MTLKNGYGKAVLACLISLAFAVTARAEDVSCAYFTLSLPEGWVQVQPLQEENGAVVGAFYNTQDSSGVSIAIFPQALSPRDMAGQIAAGMRGDGLEAGEPVEKNGFYEVSFQDEQSKGIAFFGSSQRAFAMTTLFGSSETGKEFLKGLKPKVDGLFPTF